MIARFTTLVAALVLAVSPTVRAMCDADCVKDVVEIASHGSSEAASAHCGGAAPAPAAPVPADDCGHSHDAADSMVPASKNALASAPATGPAAAPVVLLAAAPAHVPLPQGIPPDPPPSSRPLPLRI